MLVFSGSGSNVNVGHGTIMTGTNMSMSTLRKHAHTIYKCI